MQWPNLEVVRHLRGKETRKGEVSYLFITVGVCWWHTGRYLLAQVQHLLLENGQAWVVQTLKTFTQHPYLGTAVRNWAKPEQKLPGSWGKSYLESGKVIDQMPPQVSYCLQNSDSIPEGSRIYWKSKLCLKTLMSLYGVSFTSYHMLHRQGNYIVTEITWLSYMFILTLKNSIREAKADAAITHLLVASHLGLEFHQTQ